MMAPDPIAPNPYQDLYIYYLSGRLQPGLAFNPDHYIGSWEEDDFSFLFFTQPASQRVIDTLTDLPGIALIEHYHMTYEEWQGSEIVPCHIGSFTITPPWFAVDPMQKASTIILDPGVVFGTGTHPTTRDCLEALELAFADGSARSALDLGTGTGLLALAAARLGCPKTLAIDLTFLATQTARRNVCLNGLDDRILVAQGDAEKFMDFTSDLVVSNIHYHVMQRLIQTTGFLRKKRFILSGLMRSEAAHIETLLTTLPVRIMRRWNQDGIWTTFYGAIC